MQLIGTRACQSWLSFSGHSVYVVTGSRNAVFHIACHYRFARSQDEREWYRPIRRERRRVCRD